NRRLGESKTNSTASILAFVFVLVVRAASPTCSTANSRVNFGLHQRHCFASCSGQLTNSFPAPLHVSLSLASATPEGTTWPPTHATIGARLRCCTFKEPQTVTAICVHVEMYSVP